jgi:hypothetical protein
MDDGPCDFPDCDADAERGGYCWAHTKQGQRRDGRRTEVARRHESAWERLTEAAIAYAEADQDDDFSRAKDRLAQAAKQYGRKQASALIREGMAAARARGVHIARPRKLAPMVALELVAKLGGARAAAEQVGVSVRTVRRALRQARAMTEGAVSSPRAEARCCPPAR